MGVATTNKGWSATAMPAARWMVGAVALAALGACGAGGGAAEPVDGGGREAADDLAKLEAVLK